MWTVSCGLSGSSDGLHSKGGSVEATHANSTHGHSQVTAVRCASCNRANPRWCCYENFDTFSGPDPCAIRLHPYLRASPPTAAAHWFIQQPRCLSRKKNVRSRGCDSHQE